MKAFPTQPRECLLLPINSANPVKDFLLQAQEVAMEEEKHIWQSKGGIFDTPSQMWFGPNRKPMVLVGAQLPLLQHIHQLTHWAPEKVILWEKQYFWKLFPTVAHKTYTRCVICPKYNLGKPLHGSQGHFPPPK